MQLIKIEAMSDGAHENYTASLTFPAPEGWAVIPDDMYIPESFPYVDITVEGQTVTSMKEREVPEPEPGPEPEPTPANVRNEIMTAMISAQINTLVVPDATALRWKSFYPTWEVGQSYTSGYKVQEGERLWRCLQPHTSQEDWKPDTTPSLWESIDETHAGTEEDPIPYNGNMTLESGKYYTQDNVLYRCTRDTGNPVYHPLSELVGLYVERV